MYNILKYSENAESKYMYIRNCSYTLLDLCASENMVLILSVLSIINQLVNHWQQLAKNLPTCGQFFI